MELCARSDGIGAQAADGFKQILLDEDGVLNRACHANVKVCVYHSDAPLSLDIRSVGGYRLYPSILTSLFSGTFLCVKNFSQS